MKKIIGMHRIFAGELELARRLLNHENGLFDEHASEIGLLKRLGASREVVEKQEVLLSTRRSICKQLERRLANLLAKRDELKDADPDRIECGNCAAVWPVACGCFMFNPVTA